MAKSKGFLARIETPSRQVFQFWQKVKSMANGKGFEENSQKSKDFEVISMGKIFTDP